MSTEVQEPEVKEPAAIENPEPTPPAAPVKKNQHLKVEDPKVFQFSARATRSEADRIQAAIAAQKTEGEPMDIVRLTLKLLDQVERDSFPFRSFKTR